jgi:NAD(P)-dependent dehydrogenase (short-subunit alcohol dehydrogenase family)
MVVNAGERRKSDCPDREVPENRPLNAHRFCSRRSERYILDARLSFFGFQQEKAQMSLFKDGIAIVTGGAAGIGRGICEELGRRGAVVVVTDMNEDGAGVVAAGIVAAGGRAEAVRVDVSREEEVRKVIDDTVETHGRLDYIFNNAGFAMRCEVQDMTFEHWRRIIDVNLMGVIYGTNAAYAQMVRQGAGHIVNMSSVSGLTGFPTATAYSTTKAAAVALSVSLRAEGEALGVKVSVACPGYVNTDIFDESVKVNVTEGAAEGTGVEQRAERMGVEKAINTLLAGVEKNRQIIVFPFKARLMWWVNRLCPALLRSIARRVVGDFRKHK